MTSGEEASHTSPTDKISELVEAVFGKETSASLISEEMNNVRKVPELRGLVEAAQELINNAYIAQHLTKGRAGGLTAGVEIIAILENLRLSSQAPDHLPLDFEARSTDHSEAKSRALVEAVFGDKLPDRAFMHRERLKAYAVPELRGLMVHSQALIQDALSPMSSELREGLADGATMMTVLLGGLRRDQEVLDSPLPGIE